MEDVFFFLQRSEETESITENFSETSDDIAIFQKIKSKKALDVMTINAIVEYNNKNK